MKEGIKSTQLNTAITTIRVPAEPLANLETIS
jgi:hypothetical protein